ARVGYGFERPDEAWDGAVWCEAGVIHWSPPGRGASSDVIAVDALPVSGRHNQLNAMCAAGVAMGANMDRGAVREGLSEFDALSHRLEFVNCVDGVEFYDDSKATNVNSAVAGLRSLEPPLVVVAGGVDKGLDFGPFARTVAERARAAVLIGESRERIAASIRDQSSDGFRIDFADTLPGATRRAARLARRAPAGTDVVLSPACSSFDMFESYADRGDHFQEAVAQLAANGES
ncbi:MAG: glutamate ligase domain-containing protein, partial [Bradymonadaceae bacterium]